MGDLPTACGALKALTGEATAQSGKKLTVDQVNHLVEAATRIRAVPGC